MKVLVVGGGAREHIIAKKLYESGGEIYAVAKNTNPGMIRISSDFGRLNETDIESVVSYAVKKDVDLAFIGPEAPLEAGLADALREKDIGVVGPNKKAAEIETSKAYMRRLMEEHDVKGRVRSRHFSSAEGIREYIDELLGNVVIKPVGLTGGKGVKVMGDQLSSLEEAVEYSLDIINTAYGGGEVVIEEKMVGEEFTVQAFCDGKNVYAMPAVQDHKRAFENDKGPNTGGMGSYSDSNFLLPFLHEKDYEDAIDILKHITPALYKDGREYRGIMYGQFMLTAEGPKVIEINARFGDPEVMNVLTVFDDDFLELSAAIADGKGFRPSFRKQATVCKYVVPEGYGIKPEANMPVEVDEGHIKKSGANVYYASVNEVDDRIFTTSSRAMGVVSSGENIFEAERKVEKALFGIHGKIFIRHDIAKMESIERKIQRMRDIRGE